jgi:hypothetical protein
MKKTSCTILLIFVINIFHPLQSKDIAMDIAEKAARFFYPEYFASTNDFEEELLSKIEISDEKESPSCYVFNFRDDKGFIIISGTDRLSPVLAYSFEGNFTENHQNEAFDFWLEAVMDINPSEGSRIKAKTEWGKYLNEKPFAGKNVNGVAPLLSIAWGQSCYYNAQCPVDSAGNCYHARTGCGATAMAMILKYWDFPEHGFGENSYESPLYGTLSLNFENTYYDWPNMPNKLYSTSDTNEINAVAELMYHCGVAVNMVYGPSASSADNWNIRNAFTDHFNYSSQSQFIDKSDYADTVWRNIMQNEADNGRPVFYGISSGSGGHFVVMDGYQDDDYFHYNWGYGNLNGYYKTFDELPVIQQAIIELEPNSDTPAGSNGLYAYNSVFNDGSNHSDYPDNKNFHWLIHPDSASSISIMFTRFATEYKNDFVNIYDGETTASPLLGSFSGHDLPPIVQTTGNHALIEFVTNNSIADEGWELRYTTQRNGIACSCVTVFNDSTGNFDDGSGGAYYIDNADCFWLIKPDTASSINLHFENFYTETDWDFLYVYDGENPSPENLLATLTGHFSPTDIESANGSMLLHFHSDWNTHRPGWEVSYTTNYDKLELGLKVYLEGPFNGVDMNTGLNDNNSIPLEQPFYGNTSAIWYYEGDESVASIPENVVDWVLIELRDATEAASATPLTMIAKQPAFLMDNGSLIGLDGSYNLHFNKSVNQQLFVVICQRNHIPVLSANPLSKTGLIYTYDFSTAAGQAYGENQKHLGNNIYGMIGSDANGSGANDIEDKTIWSEQSGTTGYKPGDFDLDGQVNNQDKNEVWVGNTE